MATTIEKFVERCMDIVKAQPAYKLGCSSTTQCDCIGMVKYSLRKNNVSFSTTGTNWTMRYQTTNVRSINSASVLKVGDIVFKVRTPGSSGYSLPAKYQQGGSAYTGDLNDYSHIGVVKSISPLQIIHMTSPSAKTDTKIGKWAYAAELQSKYVDYGSSPEPEPGPEPEPTPTGETATVYAENGNPVKMRQKPTTSCRNYERLPVGTVVQVDQWDSDTDSKGTKWSKITYGLRKGWYMMTKFLKANS